MAVLDAGRQAGAQGVDVELAAVGEELEQRATQREGAGFGAVSRHQQAVAHALDALVGRAGGGDADLRDERERGRERPGAGRGASVGGDHAAS